MEGKYDFASIEARWQRFWERDGTFVTPNPGQPGFDPARPKYYCLDFFPYPSGAGLHVGHPEGYTATDVLARWQRMRGFNVLHPMGWDAFGLPAEQYAIETNTHPRVTTQRNVANFRRQLKSLGFSYDWTREFATTDPDYYRWTQWIFAQMYDSYYDREQNRARPIAELIKRLENEQLVVRPDGMLAPAPLAGLQPYGALEVGERYWHELSIEEQWEVLGRQRLAYIAEAPVNWCPALGTVLSNEEVTNEGRSERGDHPVFRRPLRQWMLRITAYAERLINDLDELGWPAPVKLMQRNWIGRSEGARVRFAVLRDEAGPAHAGERRSDEDAAAIEVFTTRPDTLYGATYMVLSPEHPLVDLDSPDCMVRDAWPEGTPATWRGTQTVGGHATPRGAVRAYQEFAERKTERDRTAEAKVKTGVFVGAYARNPVFAPTDPRGRIPVFIADYVLMGYGTGAIMAVPGHDTRDLEFADAFGLPVVQVVRPPEGVEWREFVDDGVSVNSPPAGPSPDGWEWCDFNGLPTPQAKRRIAEWLEQHGAGRFEVTYKQRDWLFSRQRYWGEPFPIVHGEDGGVYALADDQLPVTLPDMDDFRPLALPEDSDADPEPPLGRAREWVNVTVWLDEHGRARVVKPGSPEEASARLAGRRVIRAKRETNTMPQWAGSCWYYLRFCDPHNDAALVGREAERYWMVSLRRDGTPHRGGIDLYLGGTEHAVLHLLYARFWHKVLFDLGHVSTPEPFGKLFNQGMIRAFCYRDARGVPHAYDEIDFRDDGAYLRGSGEKLSATVEKMSKTLKNVINPDDVVREVGADALRLYELFMGPLDQSKPWNPRDVPGVFRFLQRTWRLLVDPETGRRSNKVVDSMDGDEAADRRRDDPIERALHRTIRKVTEDLNRMAFNTAIAAMMEFVNEATAAERLWRDQLERFVLLLSPFAPHICEELWLRLRLPDGAAGDDVPAGWRGLANEPWPRWDEALAVEPHVEVAVQVNGKVRARIRVPRDADQSRLETAAMDDAGVRAAIEGKSVRKVIVVPGRLVNIVVG
ncbi:MAG: leucine--tRNA ligase [Phycisphaerae bacterium]|nr:leucine--tRNA ligase [Phycisphaerae bacterium]NUQ47549.1 leucine--tRNA ligase [Phycisphaerae bacterium]